MRHTPIDNAYGKHADEVSSLFRRPMYHVLITTGLLASKLRKGASLLDMGAGRDLSSQSILSRLWHDDNKWADAL